MKVSLSQQVYIFTISCCLLFAVLVASILWYSHKVELAFSREEYTNKVENNTHILKQLIIYDDIYNSHYSADKWLRSQNKLIALLKLAPPLTPQQQIIQNSINSQSQNVKLLLNNIIDNKLKNATETIKKHLKKRLLTQLEIIRADSVQLSTVVQKDIQNVIKQQALFIIAILSVSFFILIFGSFRLTKIFRISINEVKRAFKHNHSGHFQKIQLTNQSNEFESMVKEFNAMNDKLSETTVSLKMMKKMVEERTHDLELLSKTDPLTNVANRRALFERGNEELLRVRRMHHPLSLILLDCDYFKDVNDQFGHQIGDELLKHICNICNQQIREIDFLGRYGGEEFVIILPDCDINGGVETATRIQNSLANNVLVTDGKEINVTLSMGVCSLNDQHTSFEQIINCADQAMYTAKENGRNNIQVNCKL